MKYGKFVLICLLFSVQRVFAQGPVHLSECLQWAREEHPYLKQKELYQKIADLSQKNTRVNYLPRVMLNVQATYQSDVTHVGISLPGIKIPAVSNDQYKAYLDVKQNIWDGGVTKAAIARESAEKEVEEQNVEVELYKVREQVNDLFFSSFLLQQNLAILDRKQETLEARKSDMKAKVKNGILLSSELDQVLAELIRVKQQKTVLQSDRHTVLAALAILTGKGTGRLQDLVVDAPSGSLPDTQIDRPELRLFRKQSGLLDATVIQIQKNRNPDFFGFGQAGYGRPGLNMLNDNFGSYYLVGIGLSWHVFDWKTTKREKETILLRQQLIQTQQQQFVRNVKIQLDEQYRKIMQLKEILESDRELISLQERITKSSASKLENGTLTTSDYIRDLNAEMTARITFETHKVQLESARADYLNIQGNQN